MQVKKQKLELNMKQQTDSKLGNEFIKAVYCHSAYSTYMEYTMQNAGLDATQAGLKIARRYINNLRYTGATTLVAESEEELKSLLMKVNEGERKSWLKAQHSENKDHGIQSHHFMANRWGNNGNSETLFWGAPKSLQMVIAAMKLKDACSLEVKL